MKKIPFSYCFLLFLFLSHSAFAETVFTYRSPEHQGDSRYKYDYALLKLALEKTKDDYGEYRLVPSPIMNFKRASLMAKANQLPNFIMKQSYGHELVKDLGYIPIPVDRGIVGYRVFFVSKQNKEKVAKIKTLDELRELTMVQGVGWADTEILKYSGFLVDTTTSYENIFTYVAVGRADLFPRGANELLSEYQSYKHIENLDYDENIVLYYPLPRFFYTNKANAKAIERISNGLKRAWEDGSFVALWEENYKESIDFIDFNNRRIFEIPNPNIKDLNDDYKTYLYSIRQGFSE